MYAQTLYMVYVTRHIQTFILADYCFLHADRKVLNCAIFEFVHQKCGAPLLEGEKLDIGIHLT
jgi:hypothetical protein